MIESRPTAEEWRPVPGFVNEASSWGRIRSPKKVLTPNPYSKYGHVNVSIKRVDGRRHNYPVHILVCLAFNGPKPTPGHEVRHLNGDPTDNRPQNLRWGTRKENAADRAAHGNFKTPFSVGNTMWKKAPQCRGSLEDDIPA